MYGTPQDVISMTGITPTDLGLAEKEDPDKALEDLLSIWLKRIASAINIRLGHGTVTQNDPRYEGVTDVSVRTVSKLAATAIQQRTNPIVQTGDFAVNVVNTSDVTKDLDRELKPYIRTGGSSKAKLTIFSSVAPEDTTL